jgi:hypothetical protein
MVIKYFETVILCNKVLTLQKDKETETVTRVVKKGWFRDQTVSEKKTMHYVLLHYINRAGKNAEFKWRCHDEHTVQVAFEDIQKQVIEQDKAMTDVVMEKAIDQVLLGGTDGNSN